MRTFSCNNKKQFIDVSGNYMRRGKIKAGSIQLTLWYRAYPLAYATHVQNSRKQLGKADVRRIFGDHSKLA